MTTPVLKPCAADFDPLVGTTFRVVGRWSPGDVEADGTVAVAEPTPAIDLAIVLHAVHHLDIPGPYEQFRLTFRGPASTPLGQDTYLVEHDDLHLPSLFLVPSSEQDGIRTYESSFSVARSTSQGTEP